jgi:putative ABC transport system ATP-binding protein
MKSVVQIENIWKIYKLGKVELVALKNVTLDINKGNFVSIMGASGSGKSTLLNIIGCLDIPTKGKVFLNGKDIASLDENQLAQLRGKTIGFIFQQFNLLSHLNALENVSLPMVFQGNDVEKRRKRAKELLVKVGLGDRILHQPSELSGGERQRVAIARAFANDPEMVIADEPTGNLDSVTGKKIMNLLEEFHKEENKTMIVVTHDPKIANYSEEIINIKDGEIVPEDEESKEFLWTKYDKSNK